MGRVITALRIIHYALLCIIAAACMLFVVFWFFSPDPEDHDMYTKYPDKIDKPIKSRFFRTDSYLGYVLIFQTLPFIVVAILGYSVVFLRKRIEDTSGAAAGEDKSNNLRLNLGTFPLWVRSPLGVLTGADAVFIAGILFIIVYHFGREVHNQFEILDREFHANREKFKVYGVTALGPIKLVYASYYVGAMSNLPFALLWIPVSRGSPFLRLIRVPYERAVKYHIWLAVLTLFILTVHGTCYTIFFVSINQAQEIISWDSSGESCAVLAGVIALGAGLTMWITSLSYFRRNWYEVFFGVHHLYIVFLLFWIYHVPCTIHYFSIPVLLFIVDRFLRFVQSRHSVTVLSAKVLESGAMELRFPRNNYSRKGRLQPVYQALSSWYIKFPSLPGFLGQQWHALSVMSSPMDDKNEVSIVIKPLGEWTNTLQDQLTNTSKQSGGGGVSKCPFSFKAGVEGPYGDESDFYLKYKSLVLVGGGIGVTPLLAILRDVLHRYRLQQERGESHSNLPTSIQLYHCVRKTDELCVLNSVNPLEMLPKYNSLGLDIQVHAYVTSPNPEDEENIKTFSSSKVEGGKTYDLSSCGGVPSTNSAKRLKLEFAGESSSRPAVQVEGISPVGPTGETLWVASVTLASMIGFFVLYGLTNVLWIKHVEDKFPNYSRAHLILGSMLLGTGVFGGTVIAGWYNHSYVQLKRYGEISNKGTNSNACRRELKGLEVIDEDLEEDSGAHVGSAWMGTLRFGRRPCWEDVFRGLATQCDGQNVGVLVSGSQSMLVDVASECRKHTSVNLTTLIGATQSDGVVFHFHSVSFEL